MKYLYYKIYHTPEGESLLSKVGGRKFRELAKANRLENVRGDKTVYDNSGKSIAFATEA